MGSRRVRTVGESSLVIYNINVNDIHWHVNVPYRNRIISQCHRPLFPFPFAVAVAAVAASSSVHHSRNLLVALSLSLGAALSSSSSSAQCTCKLCLDTLVKPTRCLLADMYKAENIHVLQREVHPSVEYADDILPLFSDRWASSTGATWWPRRW
jgi:hypothetical protein